MSIKKFIFLITALLYILNLVFPLFGDVFSIPVWLPSLSTFAIMLLLYPKAFANKVIFWFLVYAFVLAAYAFAGRYLTIGIGRVGSIKKMFIEFAFILPSISIFGILCYLKDFDLTKKLVSWSIFILFISFIVAVPLLVQYSSIRQALWEENSEEALSIPGLPSYSLMHSYVMILAAIGYFVRVSKGKKKIIPLILLLVLSFVIYDTFVTTSLVVMILVLLFTIFYSKDNIIPLSIVFGLLLILYESGFFVTIIDWILPAFRNMPVEEKLIDFKTSILQGSITGGTLTGRMGYHALSMRSFLSNPIFGTSVVGGHSTLLDRFGGLGLVCGIPYVMMIISFVRQSEKELKTRMAKAFFWVGVIVALIFMYSKGNWGAESWLMFVVLMPSSIYVFECQSQIRF